MSERAIDVEMCFGEFCGSLKSFVKVINMEWNPTEQQILEKLASAVVLMKQYIKADAAEFFFVDGRKLVRIIGLHIEKPSKGSALYEIDKKEIVAAQTADFKMPIIVNGRVYNKNQERTKFPKGIGRGARLPEQVLSIPVMSAQDECIAVFEFYRIRSDNFKNIEISLVKCLTGWLGRTVQKKSVEEISENITLKTWAQDFKSFVADDLKLEHFVSRALRALQEKTGAQVINFYKVENQKYKMYGQAKHGVFLEKRRELLVESNTFLETVIKGHKAIHVKEEDIGKLRSSDQESLKPNQDIAIRNYLCVPMGKPTRTLGITELMNKSHGQEFNEKDLQFSIHCGRLCSAAIDIEDKKTKKKKVFHMARSQSAAIMRNIAACPHRFDNFYNKLKEIRIPDNFYSFDFYPKIEELKFLEQFSYVIFSEVFNLKDPYDKISLRFIDFIISMEKGYRPNPYHNFEHGFNVCHTMFLITRKNRNMFLNSEIQALVVATLGHDVDHPGYTNNWIAQSENPLIQCYDNAYLENHHSNLCRLASQNSGIFSDLNSTDYKATMDLIHALIIQTDRIKGLENRFKISHLVESNEFSFNNKTHREYLLGLMMVSSDIGGQAKSFDVNSRLCRNIYKEFESERKKCISLGFDPPWLRKACAKNMPELQIIFNAEICMPCFQILDRLLHGLSPLYNNCRELNRVWESIIKEGIQCVESEEFIYKCEEP